MKKILAATKGALTKAGVLDRSGKIAEGTGSKKNGDYNKTTLGGHRYSTHDILYLQAHPHANLKGYIVHHLSASKTDDKAGNLVAMTQAAQAALHGVHNRVEFNEWVKKWGSQCPDLARVKAYYSTHLSQLTRVTRDTNRKNRIAMRSLARKGKAGAMGKGK